MKFPGRRRVGAFMAVLAGLLLLSFRLFFLVAVRAGAQASPPTVSVSANPSAIILGESTTITWSSTNADSCTASGDIGGTGSIPTSGSFTVTPQSVGSYTYIITCTGSGGSVSTNFVLSPTSTSTPPSVQSTSVSPSSPVCPASGCLPEPTPSPLLPITVPTSTTVATSTALPCASQAVAVAGIVNDATSVQAIVAPAQALGCTVITGTSDIGVPYAMVEDPSTGAVVSVFIGPQE